MILLVWVVMLLAIALALAALASTLQKLTAEAWGHWLHRRNRTKLEQAFRDHIPNLTEKDRQILGYLRHYKMKTFTADHDGGYASMLLARGFIRYIGVEGQTVDMEDTPMAVPEYVWKVLEEKPEEFPHKPEYSAGYGERVETYPWRIPAWAR